MKSIGSNKNEICIPPIEVPLAAFESAQNVLKIKEYLNLYGIAYEQLIDGKRTVLDPTTIRVIKMKE